LHALLLSTAGIVLQLPLPGHLDAGALLGAIADDKDVDCLKDSSIRRCCLLRTEPNVGPCIATAVEEVLRSLDILRSPGRRGPAVPGPQVLLLGVPPLLAYPLELCLETVGCRVACLADEEAADSAREALRRTDVLLIGARRPDVVAAQWVRDGCTILDLGLASCSAPQLNAMPPPAAAPSVEEPMPLAQPQDSREVLCLCCSDGLSAMTAVLRMRNASHAALLQQGFLEPEKTLQMQQPMPGMLDNGCAPSQQQQQFTGWMS
jgi:hypothetical protein